MAEAAAPWLLACLRVGPGDGGAEAREPVSARVSEKLHLVSVLPAISRAPTGVRSRNGTGQRAEVPVIRLTATRHSPILTERRSDRNWPAPRLDRRSGPGTGTGYPGPGCTGPLRSTIDIKGYMLTASLLSSPQLDSQRARVPCASPRYKSYMYCARVYVSLVLQQHVTAGSTTALMIISVLIC